MASLSARSSRRHCASSGAGMHCSSSALSSQMYALRFRRLRSRQRLSEMWRVMRARNAYRYSFGSCGGMAFHACRYVSFSHSSAVCMSCTIPCDSARRRPPYFSAVWRIAASSRAKYRSIMVVSSKASSPFLVILKALHPNKHRFRRVGYTFFQSIANYGVRVHENAKKPGIRQPDARFFLMRMVLTFPRGQLWPAAGSARGRRRGTSARSRGIRAGSCSGAG